MPSPTSGAGKLDFAAFLKAFDDLVARSRRGPSAPTTIGTTVSLTNPGTVGTTASAPRLMPGQGLIVATGALDYPAEYRSMAPRTLSLLGISKVMTVTSTYDHLIIQGAESGLFLARVEDLLKAGRLRAHLRGPEDPPPPGAVGDRRHPRPVRPRGKRRAGREAGPRPPAHPRLPRARAPRHRPRSPRLQAGAPPRPRPRHLRAHAVGPRPRVLHERPVGEGPRHAARDPRGPPRHLLRDDRRQACVSRTPSAGWLQGAWSPRATAVRRGRARRIVELVGPGFERFLHAKYIGHKRFSLGGEPRSPSSTRSSPTPRATACASRSSACPTAAG